MEPETMAKLIFNEITQTCPVGAGVGGWPSSRCNEFSDCDPGVDGLICWRRWLETRSADYESSDEEPGS